MKSFSEVHIENQNINFVNEELHIKERTFVIVRDNSQISNAVPQWEEQDNSDLGNGNPSNNELLYIELSGSEKYEQSANCQINNFLF